MNKIKLILGFIIIVLIILLGAEIIEMDLSRICLFGLLGILQFVFAIDYQHQEKKKFASYSFFLSFILFMITIAMFYIYLSAT
ncbi:MAG: hypothetical protein ACOWWR_07195 [Eubacteriales bacterium]